MINSYMRADAADRRFGARIRRQSSGARSSICAGAVPSWMVAQDRYHQRGAMPAPAQGHCPGRGAPRHDASDERRIRSVVYARGMTVGPVTSAWRPRYRSVGRRLEAA